MIWYIDTPVWTAQRRSSLRSRHAMQRWQTTFPEPRFTAVSWLDTETDLRPVDRVESSVECPGDLRIGLAIRAPFGHDTSARMLEIHAYETPNPEDKGGIITLAIGDIDEDVPVPFDTVQSNPNRSGEDE